MSYKIKKRVITYVFSHNYAKIKIDSYDTLPVEKILTFHNMIILVNPFSTNVSPRKFYIRRNNNIVYSIDIGRIVIAHLIR